MAQGEHRHPVEGGQQQRRKAPGLPAAPGEINKGRRGENDARRAQHLPGDGAQGGRVLGLPVGPEEGEQIVAVDAGVGVAGGGGGVFLPQPAGVLAAPEGQRAGQHRRQRQRGPRRAPAKGGQGGPPLPRRQQRGQKGHGQHRPEEQGLGLHRQGKTVEHRGRQPLFLLKEQKGGDEQKAEHAVHLFPDGGVVQKGRAEGGKGRKAQRPLLAEAPPGNGPEEGRKAQIAQDGHHADQKAHGFAARLQFQGAGDEAHRPEQQHVAGGIIGKVIRGIERAGALFGQAQGPGGKAGHIAGIALAHKGEAAAHRQRRQQHRRQRQPPGAAGRRKSRRSGHSGSSQKTKSNGPRGAVG